MSDSSNTSMIIEDVDLNRALEQIRELNTELSMHGDALAQVGALQKRIASTKGRARGLVNMVRFHSVIRHPVSGSSIDQRIAYLSDAWKTHLSDKGDYEDLEIAKGAVSDPVRIGLHKDGDESFFARVNILKDKVAELVLLDEQAAVAHKRATADNKTLNVAADMLKEVEDRQRELLANNEHCFSEKALPLPSLRRALEAIDARLNLKDTTAEEKSDLKMLAEELRLFLKFLPNSASGTTLTPQSKVTSTSELRTSLAPTETTNSSSLISGTTVPTNESLSGFTTSTGTSASASATNGYQMQADGQSLPNSDSNSTMPI
ncbi:unnamed protein product [Haemonchus placei]|uniref:L27 domain-containing protein n=1 Tax=Haemonchus placei TaxID=6290 RepID=A0A0N4W7U4_HAEPC|nr:unnamed protein product [Haemonchus placei]